MAVDPSAVSIETIRRLSADLSSRAVELSRFDDYYRGEHGTRIASQEHKAAFAKVFASYRENFMALVVDAVEERLDVQGFRYPPADESEIAGTADKGAWRIWQDNQLDARSQIAHIEALVKSVVYVLVSPFEHERIAGRSPRITIEDALQTIVEFVPGTLERTVGMKRWTDASVRLTYATLYFPNRIEKWQSAAPWQDTHGLLRGVSGRFAGNTEKWEPRVVPDEAWPLLHGLGVVPLVPLVNRPRLTGDGESELAAAIPVQDAINQLAMNMLVTSESQSFPQRWASGIEIPVDPDTGKPVESWRAAVDRFMSTEVVDAKFGQFEAADLKGYIDALDQKVQSLASITRTPYHYFLRHGGQPPSGQSIKSAETGLVRKARRKQRHFGEGWEEVLRLAFAALQDARSGVLDSETVWADPESMTESEHIDALGKRRTMLKVPLIQLWEDAGYTPGQIAGFPASLRAEAAMLANTLVEPVAPDGDATESTQQQMTP